MKLRRVTVLMNPTLHKKLLLLKKEGGYNTITHIIIEAIREFIEQKGY